MPAYGLQLPNFIFPGVSDDELFERIASLAVAGEAAGFNSIWVMDHFWQLPPLGGPHQPMLEAYTLLGGLAARTERATLGALVTGVTYRNPAILAKQVTTLDILSSGRAVLGIGAAWYEEEHDGLGVPFPPVAERMDRLEEAIQICRAMFTEEAPSFKGRYYSIDGALNLPRPVQPGGPPILVGGTGPRRTLRLVAKYADMCNIQGGPETIQRHLEILKGHCADVGRDPSEIRVTRLSSLFLTQTAAEGEKLAKDLAPLFGGPEQLKEAVVVGDSDQITEQARALIDAGVEELIFNLPIASTPEEVAAAGKVLAAAVS